MGNCASRTTAKHVSPTVVRNKEIDKQIKQDAKKLKTEVKLLLLGKPFFFFFFLLHEFTPFFFIVHSGAGESGKSTVLKQMRLIHASGFDIGERESFRLIVFDNTIAIVNLLFEAAEQLQIAFEHTEYYVSRTVDMIMEAHHVLV
jgi:guanine nucleotide-binding protein subunit alpha